MTQLELKLRDSRRITGVHLVLDGAGALIDVTAADASSLSQAIEYWHEGVRQILDALGWTSSQIGYRRVPAGASLGFTAPLDALYSATSINEWAWQSSVARLSGTTATAESLEQGVARLRVEIAEEANPPLLALAAAAQQRGVPFVSDDDECSLGLGCRSRRWPVTELPDPSVVGWDLLGEIPVLVVTGTNGKTTTTRLLAAIASSAGLTAGFTCTDGVYVGGHLVDAGDYSGPGGARQVVRHPEVEIALLETARGGLLRRGLPLQRATAVAVTNVAADHLGEFGVHDVDAIADTKLTVTRMVDASHGVVVLNADDPRLLQRGLGWGKRVTWVTLSNDHPQVRAHIEAGGTATTLQGETLTLWIDGEAHPIVNDRDLPITFGGAARYNVANALTAAALAHRAGIAVEAIEAGLRAFEPTPENSPGRGNWFEINGTRYYVDFAHNPHGFEAMVSMVSSLTYTRLGLTLGQAGDRDEASIREMTAIAARLDPDRIVIKEMPEYFRGRVAGEVPAIIESELRRLHYPAERLSHAPTEGAAVAALREWAQPGDLVLLPLHSERAAVIASLRGS